MKNQTEIHGDNTIYKEVVVIGNGPSGIIVSLMLSGRLPIINSNEHPDEMLTNRLKTIKSPNLIQQDLAFLAQGLEGRSTNPVSLLMDALLHPCADLGLDLEPLLNFQSVGKEIDHVVLGRGPPGGSWHRIDPDVLTLSLGSWMALPGKPFPACTSNEKRAFARDVASYYENYVREMGLDEYFVNEILVNSVIDLSNNETQEPVKRRDLWTKKFNREMSRVIDYFVPDDSGNKHCLFSNTLNCLLSRNQKRGRLCKRSRNFQAKSDNILAPKHEKKKTSCCCPCSGEMNLQKQSTKPFIHTQTMTNPFIESFNSPTHESKTPKWLIQATDLCTGQTKTYTCKYLVLACGTYDSPNRLEIFKSEVDPEWLVHDLRNLEKQLDQKIKKDEAADPVMIVGAGLSAADAVMAVRTRNIPVIHVFRGSNSEFTRQLPENMYPEYHKVRQMMHDGGSTYPLYTAFPEYSITDFDSVTQLVVLESKTGKEIKVKVSFAAVLIGSKPNLSFLPGKMQLGVYPDKEIDSKTNPLNINPITHEVIGQENLYAIGPLAGDNFVRYTPGGAVAVVSELYKKLEIN
ncbi:hypothetical protein ABEB36_002312 [Hypothenemus hampei]|uniref:Uncharacterized protein n=1 Tax=Hypothenemus hampei TaxID=57062 RepID=A0ABD1F5B0_HYPHA